ncbi:MAG: antibiotic biosynthesis monooxygenase family protein [Sediminicola sp.]|tara:strand:+ start:31417 stop:31734 length:318 start_codon:yes stop_codon:yes gene_type:complete
MLVRIVKLSFKKENIASFEKIFGESRELIANFKGCSQLELYRDRNDPDIFFTYSHWESGEALEKYRNSPLFKGVWAKTKELFSRPAEAWSLEKHEPFENNGPKLP